MSANVNLGTEIDKLDFKHKECVEYLVALLKSLKGERNRVGMRSYAFLSALEKVMMNAGEDAYVKYIEEKNKKKIYKHMDALFDLIDRDEGIICYYNGRMGIEGDMFGSIEVLWRTLVQCVYNGLEECGRSIEDLVWELRDER